ncbi:MAG: CCE_0567 family metalloprotein [Cyanobacteria bacterium J06621_11]
MLKTTETTTLEALKKQIRRLNSRAGQMKMDLHDIAEGLPTDLEKLPDAAAQTYDICRQLRDLKQQLKSIEKPLEATP